jgi:hypothetical protein
VDGYADESASYNKWRLWDKDYVACPFMGALMAQSDIGTEAQRDIYRIKENVVIARSSP